MRQAVAEDTTSNTALHEAVHIEGFILMGDGHHYLDEIALHEAAHAVVAYVLKVPFIKVIYDTVNTDQENPCLVWDKGLQIDTNRLTVCIAGIQAEAMAKGISTMLVGESSSILSDGPKFNLIAKHIAYTNTNGNPPFCLEDLIKHNAYELAKKVLTANWDAVLDVAAALSLRGTLTHRQVALRVRKRQQD